MTVSQSRGWDLEGPKLSGPSSNELMFLSFVLFIFAMLCYRCGDVKDVVYFSGVQSPLLLPILLFFSPLAAHEIQKTGSISSSRE